MKAITAAAEAQGPYLAPPSVTSLPTTPLTIYGHTNLRRASLVALSRCPKGILLNFLKQAKYDVTVSRGRKLTKYLHI